MKRISLLFFMALFMGLGFQSLQAQDAKEIIRKSEERLRGTKAIAQMKMTVVRPTWKREITMKSWSEGSDYSLILIQSPARDKGIVFLKRKKEVWNWVPSIERTIKMPPSMMSQSWMNSDFSNDDLVREFSIVNDYTHKIEKKETIAGRECYKIILTPKPDAPVVWGKVIMWIDVKDHLQMKTKAFDEDEYLVHTMTASGIKMLDGRLMPTRMELVPEEEEGHKTIMEYISMDFDAKIPANFFTTMNMKRVR